MTASNVHKDQKKHRKPGGLQSPDLLVRHPVFGVSMILLGSMIFGILAYFVLQKGSLVKWDVDVVNRMHIAAVASPSWMKNVMLAGYYIGQHGYIATGIILGFYFLFKRFWKEFFMVIVLYIGQGILFLSLSSLIARPRPVFSDNIRNVISHPSFPSGHMISSAIMFGLLAYFIVPKISSRAGKAAVILLAVLMVLFIGYSRFFMGAHYITDVVAGTAIGVAWMNLAILSIEMISRKAVKENEQEK
jgi:membrane-associated phospholipid phosphatase